VDEHQQEEQGELFKVEKEILIKLLEGGIISLTVDGQREIPDDIAAAQHRVGEILGLQESKKKGRTILSDEQAIQRLVQLYGAGSEITVALISALPGFGETRAVDLLKKMVARGLVERRDDSFFMVAKKTD